MRLWILTNGYGEDRAGAAIAGELLARRADLAIRAATLVTPGLEFSTRGIPVDLAGTAPPSGGFPVTGVRALIRDLPAAPRYLAYARRLARLAAPGDDYVAVGDVFLTALARGGFGRRGVHVALAKSVHGRRHLPVECALLRRWTRLVFARDEATATALASKGVRAVFVGNPLVDHLPAPVREAATVRICHSPENGSGPFSQDRNSCVLLLPGSRTEAPANLVKLLDVVRAMTQSADWTCAWPPAVQVAEGINAAVAAGWHAAGTGLRREGRVVSIETGHFEEMLARADIVLGLAGTANEQAAALGKPVVTFVGCGPQTTRSRMEEQQRLLGGAAEFVRGDSRAVAAAVSGLIEQPEERRRRGALGIARLGPQGGAGRIADVLIRELDA